MINFILYMYVVLSNFYGFRMWQYEKNNSLKLHIIFSMFSSAAMHIYELPRYVHNYSSFQMKEFKIYNLLNLIDVLFAWTLIARYIEILYSKNLLVKYLFSSILAVILAFISTEIPLTQYNTFWFSILHGTWHLVAFHLGYLFVTDINSI